ncbi:MAG: CHAD domain-containing protein [Thiolinea sp.]
MRLDTLHDDLLRSDRLLLGLDDSLLLLSPELERPLQLDGVAGMAGPHLMTELPESSLRRQLADLNQLRAVTGRESLQLELQTLLLLDDEVKTRARIHIIHLAAESATGQANTVRWLLLQTLRGYEKSGQRIATRLRAIPDTNPLVYNELTRTLGFSLSSYQAKPQLQLQADAPIKQTVCQMINAHLDIARANEAGILADIDTEHLHDYRVNLRKIRSLLSLVKGLFSAEQTAQLKQTLAGFMHVTNRLRDLDVYLLEREEYLQQVKPKLRPALDGLFDEFASERNRALKQVQRQLKSKKYQQAITALQTAFANPEQLEDGEQALRPSRPYATHLIWKRYRKVCKLAAAINKKTPDEDVHTLRIHCKKLRYLMEFFSAFFPKKSIKTLIKTLKHLQDNLGRFNDYAVQQAALQTYLDTATACLRSGSRPSRH